MPKKIALTNSKNTNNLLLFSLIVLVGVILVGNFLHQQNGQESKNVLGTEESRHGVQIKANAPHLELSARSYYAQDVETGTVLIAKNENEPALPASTTKIATALVAMSYFKNDETIIVPEKLNVEGHKMKLVSGEKITAQNLFYGLLVFSANDAAETIAANYPGGRENFVDAMNQLAKNLGLTHTHFTNPVGYDEYLHFSSAQDLVKLASLAVKDPLFAKIVATKNYQVESVDRKYIHKIENTNQLVDRMPGVLGVKTGWTENSGEDLVTLYEKDGHRVMLSVLGSSDRFGETEKILNWIFDNYEWK